MMRRFTRAGLFSGMIEIQKGPGGVDVPVYSGQRDLLVARHSRISKHIFDTITSVLLLAPLALIALALLIVNPLLNPGPLMHHQRRMGLAGQPFTALKFRTMSPAVSPTREAYDVLEEHRISRLGRFMRGTRVDELPQIINVLRGEMSLIGPRPDLYDHARVYLKNVPDYAARHQIMPGISGFAQTEVGYVDGMDGIQRKVAADLYYIAHAGFWFDMWITWRTICVIVGRRGR